MLIGGLPFGSGITRFPGLVGNDMMLMDSMGWPYDSSDFLLYPNATRYHHRQELLEVN